MKPIKSKNPLVIYVGEADHGDMSYGSLVEQIIKNSESKGLKVQVFSEYETQSQKIASGSLRNVPYDLQDHLRITKFLNDRFTKMGDLDEREEFLARTLQEYKQQELTPRKLYEKTKSQMVVTSGMYEAIEAQLSDGEETGLMNAGSENVKPFTLENFYHDFRAQFNHSFVHGRMLEDLRREVEDDADVVVIVSGFGHTYGLDQELTEFEGCSKLVVTNFLDNAPLSPETKSQIRKNETSANIGTGDLLEFEVDPKTKLASIPDEISTALSEKVQEVKTKGPQEQFLMTITDPDHSYAKHVGDIVANSKNDQGQPFFSEKIRAKSGKLSDKEAAHLLPQILELIYEGKPDQKPS